MKYSLAELDALSNAATPLGEECPEKLYLFSKDGGLIANIRSYHDGKSDQDYDFYRAARSAVPELISRIRVLEAQLENMLESHENLYKSTFGEDSDPNNDIVRLMALNALGVKS